MSDGELLQELDRMIASLRPRPTPTLPPLPFGEPAPRHESGHAGDGEEGKEEPSNPETGKGASGGVAEGGGKAMSARREKRLRALERRVEKLEAVAI